MDQTKEHQEDGHHAQTSQSLSKERFIKGLTRWADTQTDLYLYCLHLHQTFSRDKARFMLLLFFIRDHGYNTISIICFSSLSNLPNIHIMLCHITCLCSIIRLPSLFYTAIMSDSFRHYAVVVPFRSILV